jgi:hypothetical protein
MVSAWCINIPIPVSSAQSVESRYVKADISYVLLSGFDNPVETATIFPSLNPPDL